MKQPWRETRAQRSILNREEPGLLQLRVLRIGLAIDRNIRVGGFPKSKEILVRGHRPDAGGIRVGVVRVPRYERVGTGNPKTRQGAGPAVPNQSPVVDDLLELGRGSRALSRSEFRLTPNIRRIQTGEVRNERDRTILDRGQRRL